MAGSVRMVPLREGYKVWTERHGDGPIKVLLLHGGPAFTHEYLECFDPFFEKAGIEFYHYDQLGSHLSDQPEDLSLYTLERFIDEVEQVRRALGLDRDHFFLLGHSWGGLLAMEYALKHGEHLKGLVISNMTADFGRYATYNGQLRSRLPAEALAELEAFESRGAYHDPAYQDLMFRVYYPVTSAVCRSGPIR